MSLRRRLCVSALAVWLILPTPNPVLAAPPPAQTFHGLNPARVLDTRVGGVTIDGLFAGTGPVGAASRINLTIAGRGGVPASGVGAVALNVTATGPTATSYVTVWPAGQDQPTASNLNLRPGVTTPNMVIVALSPGGQISLFNESGTTQLLVDVLGWFPIGAAFTGLNPARLMDTRPGGATIDAQFVGLGVVGPASITNLTVANRGGVPASGVGAVALNVTATAPTTGSYVTVWPTGAAQPTASNLNLQPGITTPNMVIVPLGAGGQISLFNATGSTHLLVDVLGWFPTGSSFAGLNPARLMDTRFGGSTIDGQSTNLGPLGAGWIVDLQIAGRGGVPAGGAGAVALNVTATGPTADSYVTVWPAGAAKPTASNLNLQPGVTTPNMVIVALGVDGKISLYNDSGSTNILVDVLGWFAAAEPTVRISVASGDTHEQSGSSFFPQMSGDGRYITYESSAPNLVTGDTNGTSDIFVFDRTTQTTQRVSVDTAGIQGNDWSAHPAISDDGRFVTFESLATNLISNDTNGVSDVFLYDRNTATTTRISVSTGLVQANDPSGRPDITGDGGYITYHSYATNLVVGDTNGSSDVFLYSVGTGTTTRVSVMTGGGQAAGFSTAPKISDDGNYITYSSFATNLVASDTNGQSDVFLYKVSTQTTTRISVDSLGNEALGGGSSSSAISADGNYISYNSDAGNLVAGDTNGVGDVFLYNVVSGATTRISTSVHLSDLGDGPALSEDGQYIAYASLANNLVAGDTNGFFDAFVYDRVSATTTRVSVDSVGNQAMGGNTLYVAISANGRFIAFASAAVDLVAHDTNAWVDIFIHDRGSS